MSYRNEPEPTLADKFKAAIGFVAAGVAAISLVGAWAISDSVPEGHVGLKIGSFSQAYAKDLLEQGRSFNFMTTVKNIKAQQISIDVKDLRPKDKDGILFEDMDFSVFVKLNQANPAAIIDFIRTTGDITKTKDDSFSVGLNNVAKESRAAIPRAVHELSSKDIMDDKTKLEDLAKKEVQQALDAKYPGVFVVSDTNVYSVTYNPAVESSIQASAVKEAQKKTMEIESSQIEQKKQLMIQQFSTLKQVSQVTGISIDQILLSQQIATMGEHGKLQMRSEPGKAAKAEIVADMK